MTIRAPITQVLWTADTYAIRPIDRPMNKYLDPDVSWDHPDRVWNRPERRRIPMELPEYFQCPSDCTAALWDGYTHTNVPADADTPYSTWEWWGNSYAINGHWTYYYAEGNDLSLYGLLSNGALARDLINSNNSSGATEFIFFHESRLLNALHAAMPRGFAEADPPDLIGWHKQPNMHSVGFLDGHAEYRQLDTRYVDGPGWSVWPNRPWSAYWREYEDH